MKILPLLVFLAIASVVQSQTLHQNLVAYYKLNNSLTDESVNDITGIGYGVVDDIGIETTLNTSKSFNGTDSYIDLSMDDRGITDEITISAWVKTTDTKRQFVVSNYNSLADERGYFLALDNGFALIGGREGTSCAFTQCISASQINDGNWHYIAGTIKNNLWQIFVDCDLENMETSNCSSVNLSTNDPIHIGRWHEAPTGEHRYFNGSIDEVLIYDRELTSTEITQLCGLEYLNIEGPKLPNEVEQMVSIYPNPSSNVFHVVFSNAAIKEFEYTLFDLQGRDVLSGTSSAIIEVQSIPAGSYVLKMKGEGILPLEKKIVKIHS